MSVKISSPPATTAVVRRTPVLILTVCTAFTLFEGYDIVSYGVLVPALLARPDWDLTATFAGTIGSATVFGMLIGALVAGPLTDRLGRKSVFVGTAFVFSLGMALCAAAASPSQLLAFRVLVGLGSGGFLPTAVTFAVENSPLHRRNFNLAIVGSGVAVGGAAAGLLGAWAVPEFGYRVMFLLGVLPALALHLVVLKVPESISYLVAKGRTDEARRTIERHRLDIDLEEAAPDGKDAPADVSTRAAFVSLFARDSIGATVVFWIGTALCMMLIFGTNTWLPTIMVKSGYGMASSLGILGALNLGVVVGSLIASRFADRRGPKPFILLGFLTCTLALVVLASAPPVAVSYLMAVAVGFGGGGTQNLINAYLAIYYKPFNRGTGVGAALAFGRVGGIVGPVYVGTLVAAGVSSATSFYAFAVAAALALFVFAFGPRVRSMPGTAEPVPQRH